MRLRSVSLALLLLAAAATAGAEEQGAAPLESSKKALKELQADQAASKDSAATGRMTAGLPQVQGPVPGAASLELPPSAKPGRTEKDRLNKKDAQKNWLLDGVDKLGRGTKAKDRAAAGDDKKDLTDDDEEKPDSSDPDYMLKIYVEQKKEAEAKAQARQTSPGRSDPIAPFLQGWMGNSPVRGNFFDEFTRKTDPSAGPAMGPGQVDSGANHSSGTLVSVDGNRPSGPSAPQPNPYLQALEVPRSTDVGAGNAGGQTVLAPVTFGVPAGSPAMPAADPLPPIRPADKKPPFLLPSDNEKYFPQQKKF